MNTQTKNIELTFPKLSAENRKKREVGWEDMTPVRVKMRSCCSRRQKGAKAKEEEIHTTLKKKDSKSLGE